MVARNTDGPLLSNLSVLLELLDFLLKALREIPFVVPIVSSLSFNFAPSLVSEKYLLPFLLLIGESTLLAFSISFLEKALLESFLISVVETSLSVVLVVLTIEFLVESNFDSKSITDAWVGTSFDLSELENLFDWADLSRLVLDLDVEVDAVVASSNDLEWYLNVPRFVVLGSSSWTNCDVNFFTVINCDTFAYNPCKMYRKIYNNLNKDFYSYSFYLSWSMLCEILLQMDGYFLMNSYFIIWHIFTFFYLSDQIMRYTRFQQFHVPVAWFDVLVHFTLTL